MGTTWELRTATSVPRSIHDIEMDLRNKTTSEFRTVLDSPLGVPNSQVPLYCQYVYIGIMSLTLQPLHGLVFTKKLYLGHHILAINENASLDIINIA